MNKAAAKKMRRRLRRARRLRSMLRPGPISFLIANIPETEYFADIFTAYAKGERYSATYSGPKSER